MASSQRPASPPLPPLPTSESPSTSHTSTSRFIPQPITISQGSTLQPSQPSPRRGSIAAHLLSFATRSTTSLHLLSSSAPASAGSAGAGPGPLSDEARSQVLPQRSSPFSNPFKKLQSTFHSSKKSSVESTSKPEKLVSSSSSVNSMVSWRSRGAEMLSKKSWGRTRKNSEPTFGAKGLATSPIFGASLEDAVRMSHIPSTPMVPAVLYRCAEYLEAKGIHEVGLYRVPGSHASVQKLKKMFDSGKDHNLLAMDGIDPNDIATLLKLYLRELPTPLLPAVFLEQFQSVISTDRQVCHSLRGILVRLPRTNYVVLSFLCHHLSRIAAHAEKTKMNVSNLGVVFAPTLSIGSVLFKALLGGYHDTEESLESREMGLKIVWSGLAQDFEYGVQEEWDEGSLGRIANAPMVYQSSPQLLMTPAQEIVNATLMSTTPIMPPTLTVTPIDNQTFAYRESPSSSPATPKALGSIPSSVTESIQPVISVSPFSTAVAPVAIHPKAQEAAYVTPATPISPVVSDDVQMPVPIAPATIDIKHTTATTATTDIKQAAAAIAVAATATIDIKQATAATATPEQVSEVTVGSAEEDEAKLMAAMLLREELAAEEADDDDETGSNASSGTGSIPCTDTTALSAVSSPGLNTKEQAFEASFTSPSMIFSPTMKASSLLSNTAPVTSEVDSLSQSSSDLITPSALPLAIPTTITTNDQEQSSPSTLLSSSSSMTTTTVAITTGTTAVVSAASAYPVPPTINITIDSGSSLLSPTTTSAVGLLSKSVSDVSTTIPSSSSSEENDTGAVAVFTSDKDRVMTDTETVAVSDIPTSQLPPLEGLMIAL